MTVRLTVDAERCQGHASCWSTAPHLFVLDELGFAQPSQHELVAPEDVSAAESAARGCPEMAITLTS